MDGFSVDDLRADYTAGLAGLALHLFVFRNGEWDTWAARLVGLAPVTYGLLAAFIVHKTPGAELRAEWPPTDWETGVAAARMAASLMGYALLGLFSSMMVYRALFHRLNRFPGPFMARLSNFWITSKAIKNMQLYEEVQALHKQYGDIVRIGPSELSINDPKALHAINSATSKCLKGPWYNVLIPTISLQVDRDPHSHATRRKAWDKGFSAKALREYEPRVSVYTNQLLDVIQNNASKGTSMNVTKWFNFYSFDVMGSMAYNESFRMLEKGQDDFFMTVLHDSMRAIGMFSHMMWLFPIVKALPMVNEANKQYEKMLAEKTENRMKMSPENRDVFSWILEDFNAIKNPTRQDRLNLYGDAYLITTAGSDTTAASLTCLVYELAQNPKAAQALREEIDEFYKGRDPTDYSNLHKLQYLQACINEALRLHPPVPSGVQRLTPPEGLRYGDTFIPGDTIVQVPSHTMFRDERNFLRPNEFLPERWTTQKDLVKDGSVFTPFSAGAYNCVGKALAYMEIRYVMSQVMQRWTFELAPEQSAEAFINGKADTFTLTPVGLNVRFTPRA